MDIDRKKLKERLLEIARQESIKFGEDMRERMKKNLKIEKNLKEKWVKIIYLEGNDQRRPIIKEGFDQILSQFSEDGKLVEYEIINEDDFIKFQFQDEKVVNKVYNHYNDFFFGNMQQLVVNTFLTNYINELMEEGCATGTCSYLSNSHNTSCSSDNQNNKSK